MVVTAPFFDIVFIQILFSFFEQLVDTSPTVSITHPSLERPSVKLSFFTTLRFRFAAAEGGLGVVPVCSGVVLVCSGVVGFGFPLGVVASSSTLAAK